MAEETTTTTETTTAAVVTPAWHAGLAADLQDYVRKNGLADKDILTAFSATAQSDAALRQRLGAPADRLLTLPEGDNPDAWKAVWQRLGAPETADKYDFAAVKGANNVDADAEILDSARSLAASMNLPQSMAVKLAQEMQTRFEAIGTQEAADRSALVQTGLASLRQNWAQNFDANTFVATQAMKAFGMTDEQVATIQGSPNVAGAMELWRQIGTRIGEDKFVQTPGGGSNAGNVPMTRTDAASRLGELKADKEWLSRWSAGGAAEQREFARLTQMSAGVDSSGNTLG
jgi:hypothetical protein